MVPVGYMLLFQGTKEISDFFIFEFDMFDFFKMRIITIFREKRLISSDNVF